MTYEHLQPFLESERDAELLCQVAALLARGHIPPTALQVLRLGRLTALNKPDGGVRGIVVSDVLRRLVARTIAKQCSLVAEEATAPFQYALRTRAGCECVSRVLQTLTDLDPSATILSVDGVGALDLVSQCNVARVDGHGRQRSHPTLRQNVLRGGRPLSCGRMILEASTTFCKERVGNKAILSCPCCSVLDNMRL